MEDIGFYRLGDVLRILPVCRSQWFKGIRDGIYPPPVKHGKSSFWPKTVIHNLVRKIEKDGGSSEVAEEQ